MKIKIMKPILFTFFFLNILFSTSVDYNKTLELINHAKTYHWLGRYKYNDSEEFKIAKEYFNKALTSLNKIEQSKKKEALYNQIVSGIEELDIRYDNNFDNINNIYPLYSILCGFTNTYEFFDDSDVIALSFAAEEAISIIPNATTADFQYSVILTSNPENHALEDELWAILNSKINFFPRPREEVLEIISSNEYNTLYNNRFNSSVLLKLSDSFNEDDIMIAHLVENDVVQDITYMGVYLDEWNLKKNRVVKSMYSDGFVEDRRDFFFDKLILLLILIVFSLFIPTIQKYLLKIKKENYSADIIQWTSLYAFILALIVHYLLIKLFALFAPQPATLAIVPQSQIWIILFHITMTILPTVIIYFIFIITPKIKEKMNDAETISSFLAGIGLGIMFIFSTIYNLRFINADLSYYYTSMIILICIFSCWAGRYLSQFLLSNTTSTIFPFISYLFIFGLNIFSIMQNDDFKFLHISNCLLIASPILFYSSRYILENKKETNENEKNSTHNDILTLRKNINHPPKFIDPSELNDFVNNIIIKFSINHESKQKVLLIKGEPGSGKTRLANQIAKEMILNFNKKNSIDNNKDSSKWILFGDCDELNEEGSGVPFEPFSQALHDVLGAGRFEPPSKKADKIKEGLNSAGLDTILDASGLGVLNMLLGSKNEEIGTASISEMTQTVIKTILGLSKERPVIFIIDDLQWMDNISLKLFEGILNDKEIINKNIYFIFTTRDNLEPKNLAVEFLDNNNQQIDLDKLPSKEFNIKTKYNKLLKSLNFDSRSINRYLNYINDYDIDNVLTLLQSLNQLIDKDAIQIKNNKFKINNRFKLSELEPPLSIVNVIQEQIKSISENQFQIIKFAAFIGTEFKASVLSDALKMRRLTVLYDLEELEKKDIIIDLRDQDDVYTFKSSAMINVVRYMYNINSNNSAEIPQLVREYHYRIASSIEKEMESKNIDIKHSENQDIYNLAKRSWASGDRMLKKAFEYNYEAQKRAYKQYRFEESIKYGENILDIIEKLEYTDTIESVLCAHLLISQSKINIDHPPEEIDYIIEKAKLLINKFQMDIQETWMLKILTIEADAFIHDHSGYFNKQKNEIKNQINDALKSNKKLCEFDNIYAQLSLIRISENIPNEEKNNKLNNLLNSLKNIDISTANGTKTSLSAFSNIPEIDFKILESEILEELIKGQDKENNAEHTKSLLLECIKIKENKNINDKEGLAEAYNTLGYIYVQLNENKKVKEFYEKSISLAKQIGNNYIEAHARTNNANILLEQKKYQESEAEFELANKKTFEDIVLRYEIIIGLLKLSSFIKLKNIDEHINEGQILLKNKCNDLNLYNQLKELINE